MKYQCAHCQAIFDDADALCENWEDPNRNFICPRCKNYLRRGEPAKPNWRQRVANIRGRHLLWVLAFALGMVLLSRRSSLPFAFPYIATLLAALVVIIRGWFTVDIPSPTEKGMVAERIADTASSAPERGKVVQLFSDKPPRNLH